VIETDGALAAAEMQIELARLLEKEVWGQGFPQPGFSSDFTVENQRVVGEKHLKLKLSLSGRAFDAMLFFQSNPLPERIFAVYRLTVNEYKGAQSLQLNIEHWQPAA